MEALSPNEVIGLNSYEECHKEELLTCPSQLGNIVSNKRSKTGGICLIYL